MNLRDIPVVFDESIPDNCIDMCTDSRRVRLKMDTQEIVAVDLNELEYRERVKSHGN